MEIITFAQLCVGEGMKVKNKKAKVKLRSFCCELKHRPLGGDSDSEELIDTLTLQVPRLRHSKLEIQWAFALIWQKLEEPEYCDRGINQVFIFTADFKELLARIETQPFEDEPAKHLKPPSQDTYDQWQRVLENRFKQLYGISLEEWRDANN
ncbi:hypothetical protein ACX27_27365 [Nostoc piscinale CENA21]|uniref:Uncharacterized protein n=1 Tax=Nostoc piscinale CENA21 TaxID=224013 RepID=A0A0M4SVH8_9NOSO|nr:hypothetical protein [Nostoc piscinale]ALF55728.1 hypothetical protein ACX27_27365 [Nostoc piscinale CENA21]